MGTWQWRLRDSGSGHNQGYELGRRSRRWLQGGLQHHSGVQRQSPCWGLGLSRRKYSTFAKFSIDFSIIIDLKFTQN